MSGPVVVAVVEVAGMTGLVTGAARVGRGEHPAAGDPVMEPGYMPRRCIWARVVAGQVGGRQTTAAPRGYLD